MPNLWTGHTSWFIVVPYILVVTGSTWDAGRLSYDTKLDDTFCENLIFWQVLFEKDDLYPSLKAASFIPSSALNNNSLSFLLLVQERECPEKIIIEDSFLKWVWWNKQNIYERKTIMVNILRPDTCTGETFSIVYSNIISKLLCLPTAVCKVRLYLLMSWGPLKMLCANWGEHSTVSSSSGQWQKFCMRNSLGSFIRRVKNKTVPILRGFAKYKYILCVCFPWKIGAVILDVANLSWFLISNKYVISSRWQI